MPSRARSTQAVTEAGLSASRVSARTAASAPTGPLPGSGTPAPSAAITASQGRLELSGPPGDWRLARKSPSSIRAVSSARAT